MGDTIDGAYGYNEDAGFEDVSDPSFYEEDSEPGQIYLESVLPQAYDPTLEPFNTTGLNPKKYPEQTEEGFHLLPKNPYAFTYNNTDFFFQPENNRK